MTTPNTIAKARNAALFAALVLLSFAILLYVGMAKRWGAQEGFDPEYANGGYLMFAVIVSTGLMQLATAVGLMVSPGTGTIWAARTSAWIIGGAIAVFAITLCIPIPGPDPVPRFLVLLVYSPLLILVGLAAFLPQVRIARQLRLAAADSPGQANAKWMGIAIPSVYAALVAAIVFPADRRFLSYNAKDAVHAVWRVHACAHAYAARHPARGFPATERELFRENGNCVTPPATRRFSVSYRSGEKDAQGRVSNFLIRTRQDHLWGQRYESLVSDADGVIHIAYRRPATLDDHIAPFEGVSIRYYTGCINLYRLQRNRGYPLDWSVIQTEMSCANVEPRVASNVTEKSGYRITYEPLDVDSASGQAGRFILRARPLVYGETGVRSYYSDRYKTEHSTGADREATPEDRVVRECEGESAFSPWKPCPEDPD